MRHARGGSGGALAALLAVGCGGPAQPSETPVLEEDPADAVLRIGSVWESRGSEKALHSAPNPIAIQSALVVDRLELARGAAEAVETFEVEEKFQMRSGEAYRCRARAAVPVRVHFGRRDGEPALQVARPAAHAVRACDPPGFPQPERAFPEWTARFVLTGDQLVGIAPPTEQRTFLPVE